MLQVDSLLGGYKQSQVLFGVSLEVRQGEAVALLGRNGMGKTTLLQSVMGYLKPSGGRVILDGREVTGANPEELVRLGIGYVPQEANVFQTLTVRENLQLGRMASGQRRAVGIDEVIARSAFSERLGAILGESSGPVEG